MAVAPFFDRIVAAASGHVSASRADLEHALAAVIPTVEVTGADGIAQQWSAELAVNLLSRLFPTIHLSGPRDRVERLEAQAIAINPAIRFDPTAGATEHFISTSRSPARQGAISVASDGWVAKVSVAPISGPHGPPNPYSAGAAACLAVSRIFRNVFLPGTKEPSSYQLSLLTLEADGGSDEEMAPVDIGDVAMVGLGAVGQAALWVLAKHKEIQGRMWLVDDESVDLSNLQRYVLTSMGDVGADKVALADRALHTTKIERYRSKAELASFASSFNGRFLIPTVCVSVDNIEGRRGVQALLPRVVINAFTGDGSLGLSTHRFDEEGACLACLYHPRGAVPSLTDLVGMAFGLNPQRAALLLASGGALEDRELAAFAARQGLAPTAVSAWRTRPLRDLYVEHICGGGTLPMPGRGASQVVPLAHQSALAGILMGAELGSGSRPEQRAEA